MNRLLVRVELSELFGELAESGLLHHGANVTVFGPTGSNPVLSSNHVEGSSTGRVLACDARGCRIIPGPSTY